MSQKSTKNIYSYKKRIELTFPKNKKSFRKIDLVHLRVTVYIYIYNLYWEVIIYKLDISLLYAKNIIIL